MYIHFLAQSSSFLSEWPNHLNLFLFRTLSIASIPQLHTSFLLSRRDTTHPPNHSHLCPLQHWFMPLLHWPCRTSIHHATSVTAPIGFICGSCLWSNVQSTLKLGGWGRIFVIPAYCLFWTKCSVKSLSELAEQFKKKSSVSTN